MGAGGSFEPERRDIAIQPFLPPGFLGAVSVGPGCCGWELGAPGWGLGSPPELELGPRKLKSALGWWLGRKLLQAEPI